MTGIMLAARVNHRAMVLPGGDVLVEGGYSNGVYFSGAESFLYARPFALTGVSMLSEGALRFGFSNTPGVNFSAWATTDLSLSLGERTSLGSVTEIAPGQFQFTDPQATNSPQRFYRVRAN